MTNTQPKNDNPLIPKRMVALQYIDDYKKLRYLALANIVLFLLCFLRPLLGMVGIVICTYAFIVATQKIVYLKETYGID